MELEEELKDVTGKLTDTPECPDHPRVALVLEERNARKGGYSLWRCPVDDRVYADIAMVQQNLEE